MPDPTNALSPYCRLRHVASQSPRGTCQATLCDGVLTIHHGVRGINPHRVKPGHGHYWDLTSGTDADLAALHAAGFPVGDAREEMRKEANHG